MSRLSVIAVLVAVVGILAAPAIRTLADDKMTTKDVMEKMHKGKDAPVQAVIAGKADDAKLKEFLAAYEAMAAEKPKQGDAEVWKKMTAALVDSTKGLIEKKPEATASFKAAINCKACHEIFKPKKAK